MASGPGTAIVIKVFLTVKKVTSDKDWIFASTLRVYTGGIKSVDPVYASPQIFLAL